MGWVRLATPGPDQRADWSGGIRQFAPRRHDQSRGVIWISSNCYRRRTRSVSGATRNSCRPSAAASPATPSRKACHSNRYLRSRRCCRTAQQCGCQPQRCDSGIPARQKSAVPASAFGVGVNPSSEVHRPQAGHRRSRPAASPFTGPDISIQLRAERGRMADDGRRISPGGCTSLVTRHWSFVWAPAAPLPTRSAKRPCAARGNGSKCL